MIFMVIRIGLLALRRAGYDVPVIPTLRLRPTLIEQLLTSGEPPQRPFRRGPGPLGRPREE